MRQLEYERQQLDIEVVDIEHALAIREGTTRSSDSLLGRRYADAARAVADVNAILTGKPASSSGGGGGGLPASDRAKALAGQDVLTTHVTTTEILRRVIGEKYEASVKSGDVAGLSELTPLLGMLDMSELGVRLYLQYSQSVLIREMNLDVDDIVDGDGVVVVVPSSAASDTTTTTTTTATIIQREEGMSRAAMRRRAEEERKKRQNLTVPGKLAKIYNSGVTHLRHHLPMVAYALGEADGDAALVQLVHVEAEKRVVDILREYMAEKELGRTVRRAETVASKIENRYTGYSDRTGSGTSGGGGGDENEGMLFGSSMDESNIASVIMGLGVGGGGGDASTLDNIASRRHAAQRDDCGFTIEVGNLSDVDSALEEWALVMQHTESYERFVRHAVDEVLKARKLRKAQKREEMKRSKEIANARSGGGDGGGGGERVGTMLATSVLTPRGKKNATAIVDDEPDVEDRLEILPPHTALNEVAAEIGGYYSSLERCLLLAGMQRAFIHANYPDESTFTHVAIGNVNSNNTYSNIISSGSRALQTTLVDECLFAARRSTLRAFATGHTGVASAAANVCVDVLGRVLLDVLTRRAELGTSLVKPGEGLLDGQSGLGQVALTFAKTTAGKGFRGVQGAAARAGGGVGSKVGDETSVEAVKQRTMIGIARAVASLNDLEVVADYTKRLETNFLKEIDSGYPRGHMTEQLRMCVKGLGGVVDAFSQASTRATEELIATLVPRVKQIVNDSVGVDNSSSAASNFLGTAVLTPVGAPAVAKAILDYNLDDAAFELSQISEGYIGRL
jgi:hypothetical protein